MRFSHQIQSHPTDTLILLYRRILFGYVAFSISLGAMVAIVLLTQVTDLITADIGFTVTIAATILTGIGCGG